MLPRRAWTLRIRLPTTVLLLLLFLLLCGPCSSETGTDDNQELQAPIVGSLSSLDAESSLPRITEDGYPAGASADGDGVRRYECPAGFFRLRRSCYYLSAGTAPWREAYFQCAARNATLAVLNRNGKDKILRRYLTGEQFRPLERWIGGLYNWHKMHWEWGGSGDKVLYQNFADPESDGAGESAGSDDSGNKMSLAHHCIVLDPARDYRWSSRDCVEHKFYICEVSAGRINKSRRRKNIADPNAPQNQRLRAPPDSKMDVKRKLELQQRRKKKSRLRSMRMRNYWHLNDDENEIWAHGIKPGSRPPKGSSPLMKRAGLKRPRTHNGAASALGIRNRKTKKKHRDGIVKSARGRLNDESPPRLSGRPAAALLMMRQQQQQQQQQQQEVTSSTPPTPQPRVVVAHQAILDPGSGGAGAFPAATDGGRAEDVKPADRLRSLSHEEIVFPRVIAAGRDFTREEILLKS